MMAHLPSLQNEFASLGFSGDKNDSETLIKVEDLLREKTAVDFTTYATGRQNVAFLDIKISLYKRYNPLAFLVDYMMSLFIASIKAPAERMEAVAYAFDGREKELVPSALPGSVDADGVKSFGGKSEYDGFVWAIVHKDTMKALRNDRYDVSLADVKDNTKLPNWATVMSESAEITDVLLTPELIKAVEQAGDDRFENLLITDQPVERPKT